MIIAATHTDADEHGITPHPETPWKISQCQCHQDGETESVQPYGAIFEQKWHFQPTSTTNVMSLDVSKGWPSERTYEWEGSLAATRIQSFKRRLKAQLSDLSSTPPDLLDLHHNWHSLLPEQAISQFSSVFFSDSAEEEGLSQKTDSPWSDRLRELRKECNEDEEELLSGLVDPATIDVQFDDVVLDKNMMASIKTVVKLSTLEAGRTSSPILGLTNIKGALLYGPPGTGKTLLARSIAKSTTSKMLVIDPAFVKSPLRGMTERLIRAAFTLAKKLYPCVIFIDEADSLLHRRDDERVSIAAITQLLQSMNGLVSDRKGPFVLAATHRPMDLDIAILRRL
ncbi:AAA family ATPase [Colletotrichum musicola]|uniref:AAA family ATPase n=1 Tax=Colletotrichum musicola TaxID=2175873 RepID=A0A8H6ML21_9PEZI|nr:AAA family ATPase [Colletotrichum musicola]